MNVKLLTNEQLAEIFKVDLETIDKALETVKVQGESGKIKVYSEEQIEEIKKQFEKQQTAYYEITDLVLKNYEKTQKENDNKDAASIIAALFLASGKEIKASELETEDIKPEYDEEKDNEPNNEEDNDKDPNKEKKKQVKEENFDFDEEDKEYHGFISDNEIEEIDDKSELAKIREEARNFNEENTELIGTGMALDDSVNVNTNTGKMGFVLFEPFGAEQENEIEKSEHLGQNIALSNSADAFRETYNQYNNVNDEYMSIDKFDENEQINNVQRSIDAERDYLDKFDEKNTQYNERQNLKNENIYNDDERNKEEKSENITKESKVQIDQEVASGERAGSKLAVMANNQDLQRSLQAAKDYLMNVTDANESEVMQGANKMKPGTNFVMASAEMAMATQMRAKAMSEIDLNEIQSILESRRIIEGQKLSLSSREDIRQAKQCIDRFFEQNGIHNFTKFNQQQIEDFLNTTGLSDQGKIVAQLAYNINDLEKANLLQAKAVKNLKGAGRTMTARIMGDNDVYQGYQSTVSPVLGARRAYKNARKIIKGIKSTREKMQEHAQYRLKRTPYNPAEDTGKKIIEQAVRETTGMANVGSTASTFGAGAGAGAGTGIAGAGAGIGAGTSGVIVETTATGIAGMQLANGGGKVVGETVKNSVVAINKGVAAIPGKAASIGAKTVTNIKRTAETVKTTILAVKDVIIPALTSKIGAIVLAVLAVILVLAMCCCLCMGTKSSTEGAFYTHANEPEEIIGNLKTFLESIFGDSTSRDILSGKACEVKDSVGYAVLKESAKFFETYRESIIDSSLDYIRAKNFKAEKMSKFEGNMNPYPEFIFDDLDMENTIRHILGNQNPLTMINDDSDSFLGADYTYNNMREIIAMTSVKFSDDINPKEFKEYAWDLLCKSHYAEYKKFSLWGNKLNFKDEMGTINEISSGEKHILVHNTDYTNEEINQLHSYEFLDGDEIVLKEIEDEENNYHNGAITRTREENGAYINMLKEKVEEQLELEMENIRCDNYEIVEGESHVYYEPDYDTEVVVPDDPETEDIDEEVTATYIAGYDYTYTYTGRAICLGHKHIVAFPVTAVLNGNNNMYDIAKKIDEEDTSGFLINDRQNHLAVEFEGWDSPTVQEEVQIRFMEDWRQLYNIGKGETPDPTHNIPGVGPLFAAQEPLNHEIYYCKSCGKTAQLGDEIETCPTCYSAKIGSIDEITLKIQAIKNEYPDIDPERIEIIKNGLSYVGRIRYQYGASNPDDGVSDCSAYISKILGISRVGTGTMIGYPAIPGDQMVPGDLFVKTAAGGSAGHVRMFIGNNSSGYPMIIECTSSQAENGIPYGVCCRVVTDSGAYTCVSIDDVLTHNNIILEE